MVDEHWLFTAQTYLDAHIYKYIKNTKGKINWHIISKIFLQYHLAHERPALQRNACRASIHKTL